MSEPQKKTMSFFDRVKWFAIILGIVAIFSPSTITELKKMVTDIVNDVRERADLNSPTNEADRALKIKPAALEAELQNINTGALAEFARQDITVVRERAKNIQHRVLAVRERADQAYENQMGSAKLSYDTLKLYGPAQVAMLDKYLDLLDKAEKGLAKTNDASEYITVLRKIQRVTREEYLNQIVLSRALTRLERQFSR